jgi:hypothetical protein
MDLATNRTNALAMQARVGASVEPSTDLVARSPVTDPYNNERGPDFRRRWSADEREALDSLLPAIHIELMEVAMALVQCDQHDQRFEASGLAQAALIRLSQRYGEQLRSRVEFFRWAASVMRHVLVDHARWQRAAGAVQSDDADASQIGLALLAVDDALRRLERMETQQPDFVATPPMPPRRSGGPSR